MVKNGIVNPENQELCRYGIQQIFTVLLNVAVTLSIALLMDMLLESILFMAAYIPLRSYAGGYHARTPLRCCVFSGAMVTVVLSIIRFIEFSVTACIVVCTVGALIIVLLAPVADANKLLDVVERKVYRRRSLIILMVEVFVIIVLVLLGVTYIALCLMMALVVLAIMLALGKVNQRMLK
jgi:accessory gene regulator B